MPTFNSENQNTPPSWLGFVLGLLGGFALSSGLIGLVLGLALSGGMVFGGSQYAQNPTPPAAPTVPDAPAPAVPSKPIAPIDPKKDHYRGDVNATVVVVEYSDFECPFCKRHSETMKQLFAQYKGKVGWVYRHFPLSFHDNAPKQAEASECVAELGGNDAFWKFHDALFERTAAGGKGFALDKLGPLAKEVGVDQTKFQSCLDSGKYTQKVADQMAEGSAAGVQGTPGNFVVNTETKAQQEVSGAVPIGSFQAIIDPMLK